MPSAFTFQVADFSGMTGKKDLFISKVIHKAFVDVNEEGSEAAASTAVIMTRGIGRSVRVDHPFVFLIREKETESLLYRGENYDYQRIKQTRKKITLDQFSFSPHQTHRCTGGHHIIERDHASEGAPHHLEPNDEHRR
jgi:hypothetical protein